MAHYDYVLAIHGRQFATPRGLTLRAQAQGHGYRLFTIDGR
jgi:hypothetical protein